MFEWTEKWKKCINENILLRFLEQNGIKTWLVVRMLLWKSETLFFPSKNIKPFSNGYLKIAWKRCYRLFKCDIVKKTHFLRISWKYSENILNILGFFLCLTQIITCPLYRRNEMFYRTEKNELTNNFQLRWSVRFFGVFNGIDLILSRLHRKYPCRKQFLLEILFLFSITKILPNIFQKLHLFEVTLSGFVTRWWIRTLKLLFCNILRLS